MKPRITHGIVNTQIIKKLDEIGYKAFYEDYENEHIQYTAKFDFENKYKFEVVFSIECGIIEKDTEYEGLKDGELKEFTIIRRGGETLQEMFDKWFEGFEKWKTEQEKEAEAIRAHNEWMDLNNR